MPSVSSVSVPPLHRHLFRMISTDELTDVDQHYDDQCCDDDDDQLSICGSALDGGVVVQSLSGIDANVNQGFSSQESQLLSYVTMITNKIELSVTDFKAHIYLHPACSNDYIRPKNS